MTAPSGSATTASLPASEMSAGSIRAVPPAAIAFAKVSSASSDAT
jgi:hypothetical protein